MDLDFSNRAAINTTVQGYGGTDLSKEEFGAFCQWRIQLWEQCPENLHSAAYWYFVACLIVWILTTLNHFMTFILVLREQTGSARGRLFWSQLSSFALLGVMGILEIVKSITGLPGDAWGIPRIVLEFMYALPFFFGTIGGALMFVSYIRLIEQYERSVIHTSRVHVGRGLKFSLVIGLFTYLLVGVVTTIIAGIHPLWSNVAVRVREQIWAFAMFVVGIFISAGTIKVMLILSEAKTMDERAHILGVRRRISFLGFNSAIGLVTQSIISTVLNGAHFQIHTTRSGAIAFWTLQLIVTAAMVGGWSLGFRMYSWKPFDRFRRAGSITPGPNSGKTNTDEVIAHTGEEIVVQNEDQPKGTVPLQDMTPVPSLETSEEVKPKDPVSLEEDKVENHNPNPTPEDSLLTRHFSDTWIYFPKNKRSMKVGDKGGTFSPGGHSATTSPERVKRSLPDIWKP